MCGVFGYVGIETNVGATVLSALKTLEYRGYDSWGVAVAAPDGMVVDKEPGRINGSHHQFPEARSGIGHTRWATHGGVTAENAHPHVDEAGRIAVVHNGIIENHAVLKAELLDRGHAFASETDSEVVVHLVEEALDRGDSLARAVASVFEQLEGYNAIVVLDRTSEQFAAAKRVSPLVIGRGTTASTIASDAVAMHGHADELIYLDDDQLAILSATGIDVLDRTSLEPSTPFVVPIQAADNDIELGPYPHFMAKEMAEQPRALRRLVQEAQDEVRALAAAVRAADRILLVGCGTAANAALAGSYIFSQISGREANLVPASEFRYRSSYLDERTLVIAISQSGETIDVLEAVHEAQKRGARVAAIVNTPNSSLDRLVETTVHLRAGVEQCVLATKSYTAMLATLIMTACELTGDWDTGAHSVAQAADTIEAMLSSDVPQQLRELGGYVASKEHMFPIGRGVHYASALEAALKIKEVSYVHAEGFAAGELKHGVIALIEDGTPCLVFAASDITHTDVLSGAAELRSRGGYMIGVGSEPDPTFDEFVMVPESGIANVIVEALPGQLLGYFAALTRGNDPDRPRNLAKSVTVK
ncbi:MAG: glutamine--fructose-6-phosphate transaminase (isomerizing) [Thermomicrobiales bacterium]